MADSSQKADGTQVANAARWTGASKAISQAITFATTIYLARILEQDDIGLFALALVCIGFIDVAADLGISSAVIQKKTIDQDELSSCFWLLVAASICVYVFSLLAAPAALSWLFSDHRLSPIVTTMAIVFLLVPATSICMGTLSRDLRLAVVAKIELTSALARCGVSIALAAYGFGVMSLVYGFLCERFVAMVLLLRAARWRPGMAMSLACARPLLSFGANVTAARILWFGYSRMDILIVGRLLGAEILGAYALATQIAGAFLQLISAAYYRVAFPLIARLQESVDLQSVVSRANCYLAIICLPVFLGISATASDIVLVFLGDRWLATVLPLQVLSVVGAMQALSGLLPQAANAVGRPDLGTIANLVSVPVFGAGFYVGAVNFGLWGILLAWLVMFPIRYATIAITACRILHLPLSNYMQTIARPAAAATLMALLVVLLSTYQDAWTPTVRLVGSALFGLAVYVALSMLLFRQAFASIVRLMMPISERPVT